MIKSNSYISFAADVSIGTLEEEKLKSQKILFELNWEVDNVPKSCKSDVIDDVICYKKLTATILSTVKSRHFELIENLCYQVFQVLKLDFKLHKFVIKVSKYPVIYDISATTSFSIKYSAEDKNVI